MLGVFRIVYTIDDVVLVVGLSQLGVDLWSPCQLSLFRLFATCSVGTDGLHCNRGRCLLRDHDRHNCSESVRAGSQGAGDRNGRRACERALQVLGGIGFTAEHDHHHFHSRIFALDALLGTSADLTHQLGSDLPTTRVHPGFSDRSSAVSLNPVLTTEQRALRKGHQSSDLRSTLTSISIRRE